MLIFQLASITTPMYRCPEQLDLWSNHGIGAKSDIWALGCVIYYLCFQKHPFEDSAKLRIVNANYSLPGDSRYQFFHEIIRGCLQVDPNKRFDVSMILDRIGSDRYYFGNKRLATQGSGQIKSKRNQCVSMCFI